MKKLLSFLLVLCMCLPLFACNTAESCEHEWKEEILTRATSVQQGTKKQTCTKCSTSQTVKYDAPVLSSEEIYDLAEKSVGEITIYNKSNIASAKGTVFAISADGRLLTNYHVIENGYSAKVKLGATEYVVEEILAYDIDIDLAVLKINATNLTALPLMKTGVKGGSTVYAVGSSEGFTLSFSTGMVASPNREIDDVHYIQHEAAISSGNSGGPLFNAYGEVIGINTLSYIDGQNLNFAIAAEEVDNLTYGTAMTFAQYYEKECHPLKRLKRYAMSEGSWEADSQNYCALIGTTTDDDTVCLRGLFYYPNSENICLSIMYDEYYFSISIDSLGGSYDWRCNLDDYYMEGYIYPATFSSSTVLSYTYTDISSSARYTARELCSALAHLLLTFLEDDLADIDLTAYDLGFYNY